MDEITRLDDQSDSEYSQAAKWFSYSQWGSEFPKRSLLYCNSDGDIQCGLPRTLEYHILVQTTHAWTSDVEIDNKSKVGK
jgi:hypothetical protein